eukprot:GHVU01129090.1.p1 GENE.GHVU01129090.1~~GHVU01129090.1.p1  ORF type:complete len:220 (+),score=20.01 GHVU01129090.1:2269-2928(+)
MESASAVVAVDDDTQIRTFRHTALERVASSNQKLIDWDVDASVHILQDLHPVRMGDESRVVKVLTGHQTSVANTGQVQFRLSSCVREPAAGDARECVASPSQRQRHHRLMQHTFFRHSFVVFPHYANGHFMTYLFHADRHCLYVMDSLLGDGLGPAQATVDLATIVNGVPPDEPNWLHVRPRGLGTTATTTVTGRSTGMRMKSSMNVIDEQTRTHEQLG